VPVNGLVGSYFEDPFAKVHSWARPVFIALIANHASAALFRQFCPKDGTLMRIV
jgi:cytochrome b561